MKIFATLTLLLFNFLTFSQQPYWQQQVNYKIEVSLIDSTDELVGHILMDYTNNSPDTLSYIWIHLWPNAYKNDRTAFSDQLLRNNNLSFYFSKEEDKGYINRLNFTVDGAMATTEDHPKHQDIIKLMLPGKIPPGKTVRIQTPFHVKLPYNFSRGGHAGKSYQATQWYPKPAVYDRKGWHPITHLDQGEFYSEFGNFEVAISLPKEYVVASAGKKKSEEEQDGSKTVIYTQNNVHDFAWFADKELEKLEDTVAVNNHIVKVFAYFNKANKDKWKNSIRYIKQAITTKSEWLGTYPYETVSVVEKPGIGNGGMEYPTITLISVPDDETSLDEVINHEVGHNWFYGILASNEREFPWMDEGMNSYYDMKYSKLYYGNEGFNIKTKNSFIDDRIPADLLGTAIRHQVRLKQDQPINTSSEAFNQVNHNIIAYTKTAKWMQLLEKNMGSIAFESMMKRYYDTWKFKHPYPEDFQTIATEASGNISSKFTLLNSKGYWEQPQHKKTKLVFLFSAKETDKYNYIGITPIAGYNRYDKFMPGILIHNYTIPSPNFRFIIAPMYGTGSKQFGGTGRLSYHFYPGSKGSKVELAVAASRFTVDNFKDSTGTVNPMPYNKVVPMVRYTFARKPLSTKETYIQFKTFLIQETTLAFSYDPVLQADVINYPFKSSFINQLQVVLNNDRKLYPYYLRLKGEQSSRFYKADFEGNYFFNYSKGGGVNVRLYAGKFFYHGEKTFLKQYETDRYQLNLTGARGYEDYTYSDYFIGRNDFENFASQQLMIKDGGFKVGTDLLSSKVGKTDNWLSALNFTTTIPKQINPLSMLPFKIPIKVFADIGTYAETWKNDAGTGKFLFDAGLQLTILQVVNIYMPVIYSKVYKDYFNSVYTEKKFSKTLSFSIDIRNIRLRKIYPQIDY